MERGKKTGKEGTKKNEKKRENGERRRKREEEKMKRKKKEEKLTFPQLVNESTYFRKKEIHKCTWLMKSKGISY